MAASGARARSTGARERERTPSEIQDMKTDITTLKAEVANLKASLNSWTKDMEKKVDDHNNEFDNKMSEFQVNGSMQLSVLEKKFEDQFAAMMVAITDLTNRVAHIASGPPPAPPTPPGGLDSGVRRNPFGGSGDGGGKGAGKGGGAADPYPGGRVHIPAPKGMHGIEPFDGRNYMTWKPAVSDHLTGEGRDEVGVLLKWAEAKGTSYQRENEGSLAHAGRAFPC
jgi:hypothetical protein